jgi:hypothetical protein
LVVEDIVVETIAVKWYIVALTRLMRFDHSDAHIHIHTWNEARHHIYDAWPPSKFPQCPLKPCIVTLHAFIRLLVFPQCLLTVCMDALPRPSECKSPITIPHIAIICVDTAEIESKLLEGCDMYTLTTTTMVTTCTSVDAICT